MQGQDEFLSGLLKHTERSADAVAAAQDGALVALTRAYEGSIAVDPLPSVEGCERRLAIMELFVRIYLAVFEAGGLRLAGPLLVACVHAGVLHAIVAIFGWLEARRCGLDEQPHQPSAALSSSMHSHLLLRRIEVRTMLVLLRLLEQNFSVNSHPALSGECGVSASEWQASYRAAAVDAGLHQILAKLLPDLVKPLDIALVCEMLAGLVDVVEGANSAVRSLTSDGPLIAFDE